MGAEITAEIISRTDNHVLWELAVDRPEPVMMSTVVRTHDGHTVALTRDGSLALRDLSDVAVQVVGLEPQSYVVANGQWFLVDELGRVSFAVRNTGAVQLEFVDGGDDLDGAHTVVTTAVVHTSLPQHISLFATPTMSVVYVLVACVVACCVPARGRRHAHSATPSGST
jgi:hypothetical protein